MQTVILSFGRTEPLIIRSTAQIYLKKKRMVPRQLAYSQLSEDVSDLQRSSRLEKLIQDDRWRRSYDWQFFDGHFKLCSSSICWWIANSRWINKKKIIDWFLFYCFDEVDIDFNFLSYKNWCMDLAFLKKYIFVLFFS